MREASQASAARRAQEEPWRSPFRHAPVMIQTSDPDGILRDVNERWLDTLGYSEGDVVGRELGMVLLPDSAARVRDLIARHVLRGEGHVEGVPVILVKGDGGLLAMQLSLSLEPATAASPCRVVGFLVENDSSSEAEIKIRQRDTWLRAILENAPVEIVLKDRDGRFLAVSRNVADDRGADRDQVIGMRTSDFFAPEIARVYEEADRQVIESGQAVVQEVKEVENGRTRYFHNSKFPLRDDTGRIIGICSLSTEMTDFKRMEEQLYQAQKMEAVGKLTGGIAHDFNNLLMVISGNLDLITMELGHESPEIQAALRAIERGSDLTRRLLAFSRRQFLQPQPVALAGLLDEVSELVHRTMGQNVRLEVYVPDGLPAAMADPGQLHNAILNLALNARDAMPDGGTLSIGAEKVWLGETLGGARTEAPPGEYVKLSVSDTGTGIAPDILEKVFEPFFTTKGVGQGSGLGLSMVYGFVKQSGGHIAIESLVGRGTTVNLFLPLATTDAAVPPPAQTTEIQQGKGESVLFLDDDAAIRTMAETTLRDLGYRVTLAADPDGALAAHGAAGRFDLLVSDILLGAGARGTEVAQWLLRRQPDLKVLFITGYAGVDMGETDLPAGTKLLAKPFSRRNLAAALRSLLDDKVALPGQ